MGLEKAVSENENLRQQMKIIQVENQKLKEQFDLMQNWMNDHLNKCTFGYNGGAQIANSQKNDQNEDNDIIFTKSNNRWDLMSFG